MTHEITSPSDFAVARYADCNDALTGFAKRQVCGQAIVHFFARLSQEPRISADQFAI